MAGAGRPPIRWQIGAPSGDFLQDRVHLDSVRPVVICSEELGMRIDKVAVAASLWEHTAR
jgi:hypothetical protein